VGVVGLGVGAGFTVLASSKRVEADTAAAKCGACSLTERREANALDSSATSLRTVSAVGFVGGGALVAGGLGLLVASAASDEASERRRRVRAAAWVDAGSVHLACAF
jgi:hypothetical protein